MSLRTILQEKDKAIQEMVDRFDKEFTAMSVDMQKEIMRLFRSGKFDPETVAQMFGPLSDSINDIINRYPLVVKFSKDMANELGVKFVLTKEAIKNFDLLQTLNEQALQNNIAKHITDLTRFGIMSEMEGLTMAQISERVAEMFITTGRHLNAEIYTGMAMADKTIKKDFFEQAGIEKFYYDGPNDDKTRDICRQILSDPRQDTGWTMEEINSSGAPFITTAGYNCRHEWLPFIKEAAL